jgi:Transposase IS116/IS110/IS902 family
MPIVGGLDIHRKQITFDYLDTVTGQVCRGQVSPADREHLRAWLARFAGRDDVAFAVEGCTGWRYVAGELAAAGKDRFSSSRKAVRFAGLDVTVYSSDRKGPPGRLSRQGPPVLRWAVYEAGKTHARSSAPDHGYYAQVKDRCNGKRAALSEARKILRQACHILAELGDDALSAA